MLDIKDLSERIGRKLLWDIQDVDRFLDGLETVN
jgi:hypothetical protein